MKTEEEIKLKIEIIKKLLNEKENDFVFTAFCESAIQHLDWVLE